MTTSNDPTKHLDPSATPQPSLVSGKHWDEISAALSTESTAELAAWIDTDLAKLQEQFDDFVTPFSLQKSLRR